MAKEQTAILILGKDWANAAAILINEGKRSESTAETHMLIAPYDCADERGVWIKEITSQQLTRDRSGVVMKVFVPWSAIHALGVVDEECGKVQVGFPAITAGAR